MDSARAAPLSPRLRRRLLLVRVRPVGVYSQADLGPRPESGRSSSSGSSRRQQRLFGVWPSGLLAGKTAPTIGRSPSAARNALCGVLSRPSLAWRAGRDSPCAPRRLHRPARLSMDVLVLVGALGAGRAVSPSPRQHRALGLSTPSRPTADPCAAGGVRDLTGRAVAAIFTAAARVARRTEFWRPSWAGDLASCCSLARPVAA